MSEVLEQTEQWLYPWQLEWLRDRSSWKIALKARQIGWTEVIALEALLHAARHPRHTCFLVSTKVANARRQILNRIKHRWLPLLQEDADLAALLVGADVNKNETRLPNGSLIVASAYDPGRLRGNESSSYWFDEIAFWPSRIHEGLVDAVWPQIQSAANPHAVLRKVSTPWTKGENLYYRVWSNRDGQFSQFSRHHVDIKEAIARGLPMDFERLEAQTPVDKLNREYLTQFARFGDGYWSREALLELDRDEPPPELEDAPLYVGIDLGKVNDFTSVVGLRGRKGRAYIDRTRIMRSVDYNDQADIVGDLLREWNPRQTVVDVTSHPSFLDFLYDQNGLASSAIRGVQWSRIWKVKWTEQLRDHTEDETIHFDFDAVQAWDDSREQWRNHPTRQLLEDLCAVQQGETSGGNQTFKAPRDDDREGHADSWAATLCARSAIDVAEQQRTSDSPDVGYQPSPL